MTSAQVIGLVIIGVAVLAFLAFITWLWWDDQQNTVKPIREWRQRHDAQVNALKGSPTQTSPDREGQGS